MRCLHFAAVELIVTVLLSSCSLMRTHYNRPPIHMPQEYLHADQNAKASLDRWWQSFGDANLDALVIDAFKNNNELALAALNVRAAEIQTHLAVINPAVTVGYTYDYTKPLTGSVRATQFHSLTASVSYEIDLWDQLGATKDANGWEARATEQDRESAALTLIGSTVSLYYQIAQLNYQIARGDESIEYAQRTLDLVKVRANAGAASKLEVAESEQRLESQEAAQTVLIEQRVELRNALTVVLNGTPWSESAERSTLPENPPPVASDLPASLLDRRPDLRAAEFRLREALAQTDATRLSFYPILSLTGSLGTASTGLAEIVSNPLESLAGALTAPFIQVNQVKFATELARAQYDKGVIVFRKALLQALIDVDNALSARTQLTLESDRLEKSLKAAKAAEHLNEVRYRAGGVSLQSWLDSQATRRTAEITLAANRLSRLQNYATLCLALGGDPTSSIQF
jgi:NodT family efflux transporter outer membrane factor (OMF) lipoprotein